MILPVTSDVMLTVCFALIVPEAETIASRFRFSTFSAVTVVPSVRLNATFAYTIAAMTTSTTTPMMTFFRLMN